ncbi:hypothetical protein [Veronia pacifica]|uniref:DUF4189 domain-containing protein n=1 Tax=Veronia pacifica TaxID=1080227 RepID=A0A1C3EBU9_9GAMM|nr:hypothetical protein [Veronia pacifica]ODA30664.1 hypothetical protein A8L45_19510 [Veronia pacifica]
MKKLFVTGLTLLSLSLPALAHADDNSEEIRSLRQEVQMLRSDILRLEDKIYEMNKKLNSKGKSDKSDNWGCYIDDLSAGAVYGTGRTEMEAKGKTLAKCKEKGGACFSSNLQCSKAD